MTTNIKLITYCLSHPRIKPAIKEQHEPTKLKNSESKLMSFADLKIKERAS
tara:strand:+ start:227 stop:379 length:153 start_codon:yes stop_codon:yes gene_type:complete